MLHPSNILGNLPGSLSPKQLNLADLWSSFTASQKRMADHAKEVDLYRAGEYVVIDTDRVERYFENQLNEKECE